MGCWLGTCGLSKLPIFNREEIYVIVVGKGELTTSNDITYHYNSNKPLSLPVLSQYNDYGGTEYTKETIETELFINFFKEGLSSGEIKISPDTNSWDYVNEPTFQIEDEKLNFDYIIGLIERDRVYRRYNYYDRIANKSVHTFGLLGIKLFKKSIFDEVIIQNRDFYNMFIEEDYNYWVKEIILGTDHLFRMDRIEDLSTNHPYSENPFTVFYQHREYLDSIIMRGYEIKVKEFIESEKYSNEDIIESFLKAILINEAFDNLKLTWLPNSGKGSQDYHLGFYDRLADSIKKEIENIRKEDSE